MPNHMTNLISCRNPEVTAALLNEQGEVDFALITPMPDTVFRGGLGSREESEYPGELNWYGWSVANWGTKWNAYETSPIEGGVRFDTAWSHPEPIVEALSRQFPEETLLVEYADEDLGYNQGCYTVQNGVILEDRSVEDGTEEARDHAAQVKYGMSYAELEREEE